MSQARCNARRRKQAAQKFNHLAKRQRPNYKMRDPETAARHEQNLRARANQRTQNKAKSSK